MSCWNKEELESMLEDVVNELDLSDTAIEKHGPMGTPPAELVRLVLAEKDRKIALLQRDFVEIKQTPPKGCTCSNYPIMEYSCPVCGDYLRDRR